ncbi:hypothetical protein JW960_16165 [candidate division KSB1 bacterium]|nr:hypothetical protein [candidate division KSB1 bacterium]
MTKIIILWIIPIAIIITVIMDAVRDRWLPKRCRGEAWFEWHAVKWIGFFSPLIVLSYFWLDYFHFRTRYIIIFVGFALICNLLWDVFYNFKNK